MNFTFYNALLSEGELLYNLIDQLNHGFMNDFIEKLPFQYKKVIINNEVYFTYAIDHFHYMKPNQQWVNDNYTDDSVEIKLSDLHQKLYSQLIKDYIIGLKNEYHTWRLKLIDSTDKEYVSNEIDMVSRRLSYYESSIKKLDYLKPYCEDIDDSFRFLKDEIDEIKRHFTIENSSFNNSPFKIKKGNRADIMRLILALHGLKIIYKQNDEAPSQKELIEYFGIQFNDNFSKYSEEINTEASEETYIKIFKSLLEKATIQHNDKNK